MVTKKPGPLATASQKKMLSILHGNVATRLKSGRISSGV